MRTVKEDVFIAGSWEHPDIKFIPHHLGQPCGSYSVLDNTIKLRGLPAKEPVIMIWRGELLLSLMHHETIVQTLSHELTHWALNALLSQEEIYKGDDYYQAHYSERSHCLEEIVADWRENAPPRSLE